MAIRSEYKILDKAELKRVSRSRLLKKGRFVSVGWLESTDGVFRYCIGISAKIIARSSTRNRLKRVLAEWLNQQVLRLRPGVIVFVRIFRVGSENEILEDLKSVIKKQSPWLRN